MSWQGEFGFGRTALVFRGNSAENRYHAHAAIQCVVSPNGVELIDQHGRVFRGPAWMVHSGTLHRLIPASSLVLLLVEPQAPLGRGIAALHPAGPISPLEDGVMAMLSARAAIATLIPALEQRYIEPSLVADPRVLRALDHLDEGSGIQAAVVAAAHAGVSASRLRALCRAQFGVPFAKLMLWREPPRLSRRLHHLRGWSHETVEVFPRGTGASGPDGAGTPARARFAVRRDRLDQRQVRLYA